MSKFEKPKTATGMGKTNVGNATVSTAAATPTKNRKTLKKVKKPKVVLSMSRFKRLLIPRPNVLHGYLRHSEINQYLDYVERRYGNFVKVHTLGITHERRYLRGIEVNWNCPKNLIALSRQRRRPSGSSPRKIVVPAAETRNIVFIEGGTHAREWITISVALNCIYQLTEKNMRNREVLTKMRFFIVPLTNPDGYEYTMTKNPAWRKNRRPSSNGKYIGTDCNRNYDFHWEMGAAKACRNTYKGERPFSEPETRAIRNVLQKLGTNLLFLLSLHSFAQSIMYPWGYTRDLPQNWHQLHTLAQAGRDAIKTLSGRTYRTGSISGLSKHTIPGSIVDYAYGQLKVPLALVMELPASEYGFQPPPEVISPIGHESWCGIREMCRCAFDLVPAFPESDMILEDYNLDYCGGERDSTIHRGYVHKKTATVSQSYPRELKKVPPPTPTTTTNRPIGARATRK